MRWYGLAGLILGVLVLAANPASVHSQQATEKAAAVSDRLDKLAAEVRRLGEEVKQLRQAVSREPGQWQARPGVVSFTDGKKKAFDMMRGVYTETQVEPGSLLFLSNSTAWAIVPIDRISAVEVGKQDDKGVRQVVVRTKDGKKVPLQTVTRIFDVDVVWKGEEVVIHRMTYEDLEGCTISFDEKP